MNLFKLELFYNSYENVVKVIQIILIGTDVQIYVVVVWSDIRVPEETYMSELVLVTILHSHMQRLYI